MSLDIFAVGASIVKTVTLSVIIPQLPEAVTKYVVVEEGITTILPPDIPPGDHVIVPVPDAYNATESPVHTDVSADTVTVGAEVTVTVTLSTTLPHAFVAVIE